MNDTDPQTIDDAGSAADAATPSAPPSSAPPRTRWTWLRLGFALLAVLGLFAIEEAVFANPPLSFTVGAEAEAGVLRDWESAPDDQPLALHFSDGTLVELAPGARARVLALGRSGAHLVIEAGSAHVSALAPRLHVPGEEAWRVSLGPFTAEAHSGRFDVAWDPHTDEAALDVSAGDVALTGCDRERPEVLGPGEGVRASCAAQEWARVPAGAPTTP